MQSKLDPTVIYPVDYGVAPHDYDIEADSWNYGGVEVFRGVRDSEFSHADVYWIYDDNVKRLGLAEHQTGSHETFHVLWYYESPFASLLQEPGWTASDDTLWTKMSSRAYEYCIENSITTVESVQTLCKRGIWRVITPDCMEKGCPDISKVLFADHDCILYAPPSASVVWSRLRLASDGSTAQPTAPPQEAPVARMPQGRILQRPLRGHRRP